MPNIYESDNFNIISVYYTPSDEDNEGIPTHILRIQRLPLEENPEITEIYLAPSELSSDVSREDFLSLAPTLVANKLAEFEAEYDGSVSVLRDVSNFVEKFT